MPEPRDPPPTDEGWYALHDFRTIDWDAWRDTPDREREQVLAEAVEHMESTAAVEDAEDGATAIYSILGHKADVLVLHLRPSSAHIGALERRFEQTGFAGYTERTTSFVSVTEASGYSERARDYFEGDLDEDSGLANYIQTRLHPRIPDATHVCFYPMDKRRQPEQNWYELPFEERADHMAAHGDIGRDYGGRIVQMITGAIALDDWEWGVTLWGDDLTDMKDLLYEMRFDPSTSQFAEFGSFYIGRRIEPGDLPALLSGAPVPADETDVPDATQAAKQRVHANGGTSGQAHDGHEETTAHEQQASDHEETAAGTHEGSVDSTPVHPADAAEDEQTDSTEANEETDPTEHIPDQAPTDGGDGGWEEVDDLESRLKRFGIFPGEDFQVSDGYGLVLYSGADANEVADEVSGLRENFEHYDSHVMTAVRAESGRTAVISIWDAKRAANTAHGFLQDLPGVADGFGAPVDAPGASEETDSEGDGDESSGHGDHSEGETHEAAAESSSIREELAEMDVYAGQPHGEDVYALVLYSQAELETLDTEVADLRDGFDRYDTHEGTSVYDDPHSDTAAVVSLWETADAANTASEYLTDLSGIVGWAGEGDSFETMGMFYTVKPEYREDFVQTFEEVGGMLAEMDGHRETALLVNTDDENDMFIASQWDTKEDAMGFFRSDAFAETLDWGRDVLADKPRHVFLA
jgi:chlorite dismutase/heme-degrading monooxygenase HmoA